MATGKRPPSGSQRRRRPPTVINLEATEVKSGPAAAEPRPDAPAEPPQPEPSLSKAVEEAFVPPPPVRPTQAASDLPPAEPPPSEPPRDPPPGMPPEPPSDRRSFTWLPEELSWAQASAGIAGAAGGLLVFLLLWLVGAFSGSRATTQDLSPRLASIEKQLNELAARPTPPSVDPKTVEALAARLGKLESAQTASRAPVTDPVVLGRLSTMEKAVQSVADNVAALSRRNEAAGAALRETQGRLDKMSESLTRRRDSVDAALRATRSRLDKMETALNELQTTARAAAVGSDRAVRLAVATAALRTAVERGGPFTTELAVVKPLVTDASALAPLEPFAASGVPSNAALAQELTAIIQPMLRAAGEPPRDGGLLERLQANAEKLVRIRPVGEAGGDDRGAILARIEQKAAHADIPGALAELAKLPPAARGPVQGWIAKAEARNKAIEVSRRFAADAVAALKATP